MAITAAMVKELRERTGAGMMECKKALVETDGDIDAAIEHLRKTGMAKADKKAGRTAAEGLVAIKLSDDGKRAAIVEVNCETDFVAKDENFRNFVDAVAEQVLASNPADLDALLNLPMPGLHTYMHGNRIGVVVDLAGGNETLGKDIAMHIAASRPMTVSEADVPAEVIEKEKEIFAAQAAESGKPPEIIEKMIGGRIKKFLKEITLLGQPFVKNPDETVEQLLKKENAEVAGFTRFEVGEGIEKKQENFADEVMAQVKG